MPLPPAQDDANPAAAAARNPAADAATPPARGTGRARVFAMLAYPIGHAQSPGLFNALFETRGQDALMVPLTAAPEDFDRLWAGIDAATNIEGVIVSLPFKTRVLAKARRLGPQAAAMGAANALRRLPGGGWEAENFDGAGFLAALAAGGHRVAGQDIVLVGAGGAGSALAFGLAGAGAARLRLHDSDQARAADLARRAQAAFPATAISAGPPEIGRAYDMAINATPLGMRPDDPLPIAPGLLRPGLTLVDIIMQPAETALMRAARAQGCRVQAGAPMMAHQMQAMAGFFGLADGARGRGNG